jgi:cytochrome P450
MADDAAPLVYDPDDAATRADPFRLFERLRRDDPVHWSPVLKSWVLTRYEDCRLALTSPALSAERVRAFLARRGGDPGDLGLLRAQMDRWMVFRDPPDHTRLRGLVNRAFTPQAVAARAPAIAALVDELLEPLADRPGFDLIADFAEPLPAYVIMDMLGVPRAELRHVRRWSDELALFVGAARGTGESRYDRAEEGARRLADYFRDLVAERRRQPRDDLTTALLRAREAGEALDDEEVVATAVLLLFAGHETTTHLIGNGVLHMLRLGTPWRELAAGPAAAESTVEECLRYDGPIGAIGRVVAAPIAIGGRRLGEGERIFALLNAANRDPAAFADADRFDPRRSPNRHLTFGHGIHFCLGAPLARLEGRIALQQLARRFPRLALAGGAPDWVDSLVLRGLVRLPVLRAES